jgi:hypothetical protein
MELISRPHPMVEVELKNRNHESDNLNCKRTVFIRI